MIKKYKAAFVAFGILSMLVAVFGAAWSWQDSRCDAETLRSQLIGAEQRTAELAAELKREKDLRLELERIAADRNKERDKAAEKAKTLQQELDNAKKQNPQLAQCFDMPLPDVLIERLSNKLHYQN